MKYMGSKFRIAKYIVPMIQEEINRRGITEYYEPFVGGCNVIDKIQCEHKYGSDNNRYLIALLKHMQLSGNSTALYDAVPRELYNQAKQCYINGTQEFSDWQLGNIGFLASFNGKWFDGGYAKPGYETTKHGKRYRDYYQEAKRNLLHQMPNLMDVQFTYCDYKTIDPHGAVIYCDPPYQNTTKYAVAQEFDYGEFWGTMRCWSKDNVVFVSKEHAPDDIPCVWQRETSRSLNARGKSISTEKLYRLC